MKSRRLKKSVVYALYALSFITIMGTIYMLEMISSPSRLEDDTIYVNDTIIENDTPVVSIKNVIIKPFLSDGVTIGRTFYNYQDDEEKQQNSLIYYQDTYLPNSGVDYVSEETFDVLSILDGKVTKVTDNNLLGKIVEITHTNSIISVYQSLGEINIAEGDEVLQGQIIGKSGVANIATDLGNHLHFELIINGKNVNPEEYYDKQLEEL